jgi:thioredoxin reductase
MRDAEVVIVGGGPAGLSAALVLGRARRRVVLFDSGEYRNAAARRMHGFLSRDGVAPGELRRIARAELRPYASVELRETAVINARATGGGFEVMARDGEPVRCRKLLLATGVVDELPPLPGVEALYGRVVHHCPYCEGWELRDQPLAVYGGGDACAGALAFELMAWSRDVVVCSDGPVGLSPAWAARLARRRVRVVETRVARLEGDDESVTIVLRDGERLQRRALFFNVGRRQRSDLALRLGAATDGSYGVEVNKYEATRVPGLYVAGDATRDVLQAIVGAGEGCQAAVAIHSALLEEDWDRA